MADNKVDMSLDELVNLLVNNDVPLFDPVHEAFKVYDPKEEGLITFANMKRVYEQLGMPALSEEDLSILLSVADADNDGKVSLSDFRTLFDSGILNDGLAINSIELGPAV